jgi:hypothetical protein
VEPDVLERMPQAELIELIVAAVSLRAEQVRE